MEEVTRTPYMGYKDGLHTKARWVKDEHRTPDPKESNYAGVVSRDSVRIAINYAALNDADVTAADTQNA